MTPTVTEPSDSNDGATEPSNTNEDSEKVEPVAKEQKSGSSASSSGKKNNDNFGKAFFNGVKNSLSGK